MPVFKLFYSWQSDRPGQGCRHLIDKALRDGAGVAGREIGVEIQVDSDTQGEPGTPPITDTILRKIRECDAFVGDMSFVAATEAGKLLPNPNVMGEYGYALSEKGTRRILLIMNTAFGPPENLPFDLGHLRRPITYEAPVGIADGARRTIRAALAKRLEEPLKLLVSHAAAIAAEEQANDPAAATAARAAIDSLAASTEIGFKPAVVSEPKVLLHVAPFGAFARRQLDIRFARRVVSTLAPSGLTASESGLDENEWWIHGQGSVIPGRPNRETTWYVRLIQPGIFEVALNLGRIIDDDPRALVDGYKVEAAIIDMLDRCAGAASELGLAGPGIVSAVLVCGEEVDVIMGRTSGRLRKPFVVLGQVTIAEIGRPVGDHLQPLFDRLWLSAGMSGGSNSFERGGWAGYRGELPYRL
jgi:hypothetical protein